MRLRRLPQRWHDTRCLSVLEAGMVKGVTPPCFPAVESSRIAWWWVGWWGSGGWW